MGRQQCYQSSGSKRSVDVISITNKGLNYSYEKHKQAKTGLRKAVLKKSIEKLQVIEKTLIRKNVIVKN